MSLVIMRRTMLFKGSHPSRKSRWKNFANGGGATHFNTSIYLLGIQVYGKYEEKAFIILYKTPMWGSLLYK